MTIAEFNAMGWTPGMTADYQGKTYPIASCDFEEQLVGLQRVLECESEDVVWVRCENVTVHKPNATNDGRAIDRAVDGIVGLLTQEDSARVRDDLLTAINTRR